MVVTLMGMKTKVLLWLGGVFAAVTAAMLFRVPGGDNQVWWGPVVIASAFFAFYAVSFGTSRWALTAIPGFILTVAGISYFRFHHADPMAWAVLAAVVALGLLNVFVARKALRH
jgi:hypothetical protein